MYCHAPTVWKSILQVPSQSWSSTSAHFSKFFCTFIFQQGMLQPGINDVHSSPRRVNCHRNTCHGRETQATLAIAILRRGTHANAPRDKCRSKQSISRKVRRPEEVPSQIFHGHLNMGLPQDGTRMSGVWTRFRG